MQFRVHYEEYVYSNCFNFIYRWWIFAVRHTLIHRISMSMCRHTKSFTFIIIIIIKNNFENCWARNCRIIRSKRRLSPSGLTTKCSVYGVPTNHVDTIRWKWKSRSINFKTTGAESKLCDTLILLYKFMSNCFSCHRIVPPQKYFFKVNEIFLYKFCYCRPFIWNVYCLMSEIRSDSYHLLHHQYHYFAQFLTLRYA